MPPCLPHHRAPAQALKRGWTQFILILPQSVSVPWGQHACPTPSTLGSARPPNPVDPSRDTGAGRAHLWQFPGQHAVQQKGTSCTINLLPWALFFLPPRRATVTLWETRCFLLSSMGQVQWEPLFPSCTHHAGPLPWQSWVAGASTPGC